MKQIYRKLISIYLLFITTTIYPNSYNEKEIAKNIKARILEDGFSVEITWTPPEEEGEIIVARSKERIDTPEKLYYADSLGRFPNKGNNKLSSLRDINLKPGVYYYAVAMVSRIKKRDVILIPNQNYTYDPVDIGQPVQIIKLGRNEVLPYAHDNTRSISDIEVKVYKDYNQIRWVHPLNAENTKPTYNLYRSEEPLSSIQLMKQANKIVELKYPDNFYVDKNVEPGKIYYYGVSVSIQGEEFIPLVEHKSFIRTVYANNPLPTKKEIISSEVTTNVQTTPQKSEKVSQTGAAPKKEIREEKVNVLEASKQEEPKKEILANEVKQEESKKEVPAKEIAIKTNTEEKLSPQKSKEEEISHVQDINFEYRGDGVFLTWAAPNDAIPHATIYSIYLFYSFPKNPEKYIEQGKALKLGEVVHPDMSFSIPKIDRKRAIYLAVSVKHGTNREQMHFILEESLVKIDPEKEVLAKKEETKTLNMDHSHSKKIEKEEEAEQESPTTASIVEPTSVAETSLKEKEVPKDKKSSEDLEFDRIMQEYKKKKYEKARELFDKFAEKEITPKMKAKAIFYSALCDYNLGNYDRSLNKLLQRELKNYSDSERVDFYINRCVEKKAMK